MKKYFILTIFLMLPIIFSCSSSKEVSERRNLMMPKLSEVPRNAGKYKDVGYDKKDKKKKKSQKRRTSYGRR